MLTVEASTLETERALMATDSVFPTDPNNNCPCCKVPAPAWTLKLSPVEFGVVSKSERSTVKRVELAVPRMRVLLVPNKEVKAALLVNTTGC